MRKLICFLLTVYLSFCVCGCSNNGNIDGSEVTFYYLRSNIQYSATSPLLVEEQRSISHIDNDPFSIVSLYIEGPTDNNCVNPFPAGTTLKSMEINDGTASLVLSSELLTLSSAKETIAFACITKTIVELTGTENIIIAIEDDSGHPKENYQFSNDSFSFYDSVNVNDIAPS